MWLTHLSHQHPGSVGAYVDQMHTTEAIAPVVLEAFAVMEEPA
jgi:hypothetical protein